MKTFLTVLLNHCFSLRKKAESRGQTLVEYALILVLVSIVLFAILFAFRDSLLAIFGKVTQTLSVASGS